MASPRCPVCGIEIPVKYWALGRFHCPGCRTGFALSDSYFKVLFFVAALLTMLARFALGIRGGLDGITITFVSILVIWLLLIGITILIFPVDLEETSYVPPLPPEFRDGADPETSTHSSYLPSREEEGSGYAPKFQPVQSSNVFQWGIPAALFVAGVLNILEFGTGVLDLVRPNRVEIKDAQEGFPLRAELGPDMITFTNLSAEEWSCQAVLGRRGEVSAEFPLASHQRRAIKYVDFLPPRPTVGASRLRSDARDQLWARCTEPSGLFRTGVLK